MANPPTRHQAIARLNSTEPLNQAAGRLLPDSWQGDTSLNILSLALWGIREARIDSGPGGAGSPIEAIEATVLRLMDADPTLAFQWLKGERRSADGALEVTMQDDALDASDDARQAAWRIIDEIGSALAADRFLPPRLSGAPA